MIGDYSPEKLESEREPQVAIPQSNLAKHQPNKRKHKNNETDLQVDDMNDNKHVMSTMAYYKSDFRDNSTNQGSGFQFTHSLYDREPTVEHKLTKISSSIHGPKLQELGPKGLLHLKEIQDQVQFVETTANQPFEFSEDSVSSGLSISEKQYQITEPSLKLNQENLEKKVLKKPTILVQGPQDGNSIPSPERKQSLKEMQKKQSNRTNTTSLLMQTEDFGNTPEGNQSILSFTPGPEDEAKLQHIKRPLPNFRFIEDTESVGSKLKVLSDYYTELISPFEMKKII